jgi:hypothetical protein
VAVESTEEPIKVLDVVKAPLKPFVFRRKTIGMMRRLICSMMFWLKALVDWSVDGFGSEEKLMRIYRSLEK